MAGIPEEHYAVPLFIAVFSPIVLACIHGRGCWIVFLPAVYLGILFWTYRQVRTRPNWKACMLWTFFGLCTILYVMRWFWVVAICCCFYGECP